ncbi:hypothetical protein LINPERPRIM_LOCUS15764, partial [Linum perenne]
NRLQSTDTRLQQRNRDSSDLAQTNNKRYKQEGKGTIFPGRGNSRSLSRRTAEHHQERRSPQSPIQRTNPSSSQKQ